MRIESTSFASTDLDSFLDDLVDQDRRTLVGRLERASARLADLGSRVSDDAPAGDEQWNAKEVLAHVALLSKFYGVLAYRIGSGATTELDLLGQVSLRDVMGEQLAQRPAAELVASALADHGRTAEWLRGARPGDLRRRCSIGGGGSMTAEEVARLPLCAHLEQHLDQMERLLM